MRHLIHHPFTFCRFRTFFFGSLAGICMSFCIGLIAIVLVALQPVFGNVLLANSNSEQDIVLKKVADYRKDLKTFVKRSKSKDEAIRFGAVINLCLLHTEIVEDERFESNQQLQGFRAIASDRLNKCRKEIELEMLRADRAAKKKGGQRSNEPEPSEAKEGETPYQLYQKIIAQDMQAIVSITGGPLNLWQYTGNPAGPLCDYGPDLVNLIETTINPDFWRRNGGNGIIEYYQPLRIIVVGASSQIHNEISDLLSTLRSNGR